MALVFRPTNGSAAPVAANAAFGLGTQAAAAYRQTCRKCTREELTHRLTHIVPLRDNMRESKDFSEQRQETELKVAIICDVLLEGLGGVLGIGAIRGYMDRTGKLTTNELQLEKGKLLLERDKRPIAELKNHELGWKIAIVEWAMYNANSAGRNAWGQPLDFDQQGIMPEPKPMEPVIPVKMVSEVEDIILKVELSIVMPFERQEARMRLHELTLQAEEIVREKLKNGEVTVEQLEARATQTYEYANNGRQTPEKKLAMEWAVTTINEAISKEKWGNRRDMYVR